MKRWLTKPDNDAAIQKEELLNRLKQIANTTAQDLYKEAVRSIKGYDLWGKIEKLRH